MPAPPLASSQCLRPPCPESDPRRRPRRAPGASPLRWRADWPQPTTRYALRLLQIFENQFASAGPVEGEHHGPKAPKQAADSACDARFHVAAVEQVAGHRTNHCTIGRDQGRIRSQADAFKQRRGVGHAPARSDGHGDARSCAARSARALRLLTAVLRVGSRVPSISIATRRTGGCMNPVYGRIEQRTVNGNGLDPGLVRYSVRYGTNLQPMPRRAGAAN